MRVGWGYGNKSIIEQLYRVKKPFNVGRIAIDAAITSLNKQWIKKQALLNILNKNIIVNKLNNTDLEILDTQANFILIKLKQKKDANKLNDFALKNNITIRSLNSYGLPNYFRISIGTYKEMKQTVKVFNKFNV